MLSKPEIRHIDMGEGGKKGRFSPPIDDFFFDVVNDSSFEPKNKCNIVRFIQFWSIFFREVENLCMKSLLYGVDGFFKEKV